MTNMNNPDPYRRRRMMGEDGMSTGTILAGVVAAALIIGGLFWVLSDRSGPTTAANPPTQTSPTTGQGDRAPAPPAQQK
jgi:hypothetical protein